jgi:hypothetical protein
MAQHPVLSTSASIAAVASAETTIVSNLPAVLGNAGIPISGTIMNAKQTVALVQSHLDATAHVADLRAELKAAIHAADALRATIKAAVICIRGYVAALYGEHSTQYASLGFEPRKPPHKSAKTTAEAVDKSLATRAARHTMGKRQRAKIVVELPAAPAQAAAPATSSAAEPAPIPSSGSGDAVATSGIVAHDNALVRPPSPTPDPIPSPTAPIPTPTATPILTPIPTIPT